MSLAIGILGGGISGLSALHGSKNVKSDFPVSVRLLERSSHVGGWMNTGRSRISGKEVDHMYEKGPRSIRGSGGGQATLALITQLGLSSHLLTPSRNSSTRFLYMGGHITKMPTSPLEVFSSPIRRFIPAILKDAFLRRFPPSNADESVASFFERHVGTKATQEMVGGIVVGIYGGNMDQLSMKSCFPTFFDAATKHGSLVRGLLLTPSPLSQADTLAATLQLSNSEKAQYLQNIELVKNGGGMFSFQGGIGELAASIANTYHDSINTSITASRIVKNVKTGKIEILSDTPSAPDFFEFDRVIASIPSFELAPLLSDISPKSSAMLAEIEFANMAVVSLAFEEAGQKVIPAKWEGFGYLVPPSENRSILGVSFDSVTFPSHSNGSRLVRMAVMIGGNTSNNAKAVNVLEKTENELLDIARQAIREDMGISIPPCSSNVFIAQNAIPQYAVGHQDRMKAIESQLALDLPQLTLSGASYYGVSVNDCVASGLRAAAHSLNPL